jgi:hypothetical protein
MGDVGYVTGDSDPRVGMEARNTREEQIRAVSRLIEHDALDVKEYLLRPMGPAVTRSGGRGYRRMKETS